VRVEFSKNRFISVLPLSRSSFFEVWRFRATKPSARSRRSFTSTSFKSVAERKWRFGNEKVRCRTSFRPGGASLIKAPSYARRAAKGSAAVVRPQPGAHRPLPSRAAALSAQGVQPGRISVAAVSLFTFVNLFDRQVGTLDHLF